MFGEWFLCPNAKVFLSKNNSLYSSLITRTFLRSIPLRGDDTAHVLRWRDRDTRGLCHDPVRLRFEYADADVYNVAF